MEANSALAEIIRNHTKPLLFVEGKTDKLIIETAWDKLNPNISQPFYIADRLEGDNVENLYKELERADIFQNKDVL